MSGSRSSLGPLGFAAYSSAASLKKEDEVVVTRQGGTLHQNLLIFRTIVRAISPTTIQKLHFRIFSKGEALA